MQLDRTFFGIFSTLPMGILFEWSKMNKAILRRPRNFAQSSLWFGRLLRKCPNHVEDCANFCGLLRKAELCQIPLVFSSLNFQEFWWKFLIYFNFSSLFNFIRERNNSKILSEFLKTKFQSHLCFSYWEFQELISSEFLKNFWRRCLQLWYKIIIKDTVFINRQYPMPSLPLPRVGHSHLFFNINREDIIDTILTQ